MNSVGVLLFFVFFSFFFFFLLFVVKIMAQCRVVSDMENLVCCADAKDDV